MLDARNAERNHAKRDGREAEGIVIVGKGHRQRVVAFRELANGDHLRTNRVDTPVLKILMDSIFDHTNGVAVARYLRIARPLKDPITDSAMNIHRHNVTCRRRCRRYPRWIKKANALDAISAHVQATTNEATWCDISGL